MKPKFRMFFGALLLTVPLDYATKRWIEASLTYADRLPVIEGFFYLTHVRNPGAAFGLFTTGPAELRQAFFIGVSLLAAVLLGLVLGGAVGNLIDRVRYGEVIDFLHFRRWRGYSWPDFNLADSFIVTGVGFLVIELLASEGARRGDPSREENDRSQSG
jgi:signal peptidase II